MNTNNLNPFFDNAGREEKVLKEAKNEIGWIENNRHWMRSYKNPRNQENNLQGLGNLRRQALHLY